MPAIPTLLDISSPRRNRLSVTSKSRKRREPMAMGIEQIRTERPVKNTVHNLVQTLSVKLDSAARYHLYEEDAKEEGLEDCVDVFARLADRDRESIDDLLQCLKDHIDDA
jgi:hypothetical protein